MKSLPILLNSPIEDISHDTLNLLIEEKIAENEHIEFKESLSSHGLNDPWVENQTKVADHAKTKILEEIVAFANAYGGVLLVGIKESKNNKSVAESIKTLPKCEELVNRFKHFCRDLIEPIIPHLEFKGIQTDGNGGGVMMIRVGKSRNAPHRVKTKNKCTIRRQDRCEVMSMREIQDLTLNTLRGLDRIEDKLNERKRKFKEEFGRLKHPNQAFGLRITSLPVDENSFVAKVFHNQTIKHELSRPMIKILRGKQPCQESSLLPNLLPAFYRPILRGAREENFNSCEVNVSLGVYGEIYSDGLIELGFITTHEYFIKFDCFLSNYALGLMAQMLAWIDKVKSSSLLITSEYTIQVEFLVNNAAIPLCYDQFHRSHKGIDTNLKSLVFPNYSYGGHSEVDDLLKLFERDLLNSVGLPVAPQQHMYEFKLD